MEIKSRLSLIVFVILFTSRLLQAEESILFSDIRGDYIKQENAFDYSTINLLDKTNKAWCLNLKEPYTWIKKGFLIEFEKPTTIRHLYIKNGIGDGENFKLNNRVRKISLFSSENFISGWKLIQTITLKDIEKTQKIELDDEINVKSLAFNIDEIYKGKQKKYTCLSELSFSKPELFNEKNTTNINGSNYKHLTIEQMKITPQLDGTLIGEGEGFCLCRCKFEKGFWKNISPEQTYLQILISMPASCGLEGTNLPKGNKFHERLLFIENINKQDTTSPNSN